MRLSDISVSPHIDTPDIIPTLFPCAYCKINKAQLTWYLISYKYDAYDQHGVYHRRADFYVCSPECINAYILSLD